MKRSKGGVFITSHSKNRAKQRAGITKKQMTTMASRAINDGLTHSEVAGSLKQWMDAEYFKYETANNCRFYANQLYIFHNLTLITIINAPLFYEQDLHKYVKNLRIFLQYKKNRYKYKKNYADKLEEIFTDTIIDTIKNDIIKYLKNLDYENHNPYDFVKVCPRSFQVNIAYYNAKPNKKINAMISEHINKYYGLDTQFVKGKLLEN